MGKQSKTRLDELLADPIIEAIGLVTVNAGAFELAVTHLLWALAGPPETKRIDPAPRRPRTLGRKLESLRRSAETELVDVDLRDAINSLVDTGFRLSDERARVVHGVTLEMQAADGRYTRILGSWRGEYEEAIEHFTLEEVLELATQLWDAREEAIRLATHLVGGEMWRTT
jgi:hypothetical protein